MKYLIILVISLNLFGNSICNQPVIDFETDHGKIEIKFLEQINNLEFSLTKNTSNICNSFEEFKKEEGNTELYQKFLNYKYQTTNADATTFLELFLRKDKPDIFLNLIISEQYEAAKNYLIKKTYILN